MTANQIAYWNLQEQKRSNQVREGETMRHNLTTESETARDNVFKNRESRRANLAKERETERHNVATEYQARDELGLKKTQTVINVIDNFTDKLMGIRDTALKGLTAVAKAL